MSEPELKSWFLGPQGQNSAQLHELTQMVIDRAAQWRKGGAVPPAGALPDDALERGVTLLLDYLQTRTVPAYSSRYQAHMGWDLLLPGIIGHFIGVLFPSNNVAYEGSPGTTVLEMLVGRDLCRMLGYPEEAGKIRPWAHLVGGGTIGNIEALWAARNVKFLPLALQRTLAQAGVQRSIDVSVCTTGKDERRPLESLATWDLLNIPLDESLALPALAADALGLNPTARLEFECALNEQGVNQKGLHFFLNDGVRPPKILASHDNHYSLEKAAALLGLGQGNLDFIQVDEFGRMKLDELEDRLLSCERDRVPVLAVVANLGSTELGAVDDLSGILALRTKFRGRLDFMVHVDAAFGGYHACLLRDHFDLDWMPNGSSVSAAALGAPTFKACASVPRIGLSAYTKRQFESLPGADSVTVDPHKLGFLPYPGGAICYRNSALRDLTKFSAPYLGAIVPQGIGQIDERTDQFLGIFGVEGSRSGGAAAALFLTHSLLRPTQEGYGQLSGKELYASKRVFAALLRLSSESKDFTVAAAGTYPKSLSSLVEVAKKEDREIDPGDVALLEDCGPDLNLLCYLLNFKHEDQWNEELVWLHVFNLLIYGELELKLETAMTQPLIVSRTIFAGREGTAFIGAMLRRLRMTPPADMRQVAIVALRSAEWNPWLTEQDRKLDDFRHALSDAATRARAKVIECMGRCAKGVSELQNVGTDDLVIATGVVGSIGADSGNPFSTASDIMKGLVLIQDRLALRDLPAQALAHFAGRQ